ncbi:hypothetical protein [Dyadobacter sp.]|uniref:hypothetical protein n=1 Tax=Dyadobacter sp. TaxID=1914288 RepID=UPI003F710BFF
MIDSIQNQKQFEQNMNRIESYLLKATSNGGFKALNRHELAELQQLSVLAEQYEDTIFNVMPIAVKEA